MDNQTSHLRRLDFRTGIILALLAIGLIWEATSYPMSDSYGGVQNVWYVSPALFPLLVGGLLLLLSLMLVANAVAYHGWPGVLREQQKTTSWFDERNQRFLAILVLIATYVYAFIPTVDFYIGTAFFLFAFIAAFYLERHEMLVISTLFFFVVGVALGITDGQIGKSVSQFAVDGFATLAFIILCLLIVRLCLQRALGIRRFRTTLLVALLVPLVLCPVFKFGLLVPLPTEGFYIEAMEQVKYLLRASG
ncbi:MAG: tripartite tricarboxylate transporter TctB family protein [Candidatus Competibacteraceae bacterium]|nr:tripartite tricarboxylate transporter TctB family protein [Candidatus Competibacteraceae bacterium]